MASSEKQILSVNGGSSSIKFAVYLPVESLPCLLKGTIEACDSGSVLTFSSKETIDQQVVKLKANDPADLATALIGWLQEQPLFQAPVMIGHRIVHGMNHLQPEIISSKILDDLQRIIPYDPEHLPEEIKLIRLFQQQFPNAKQVACYDTSFFADMPNVAKLIPIPRRYLSKGIHRYGFHGLSYSFLMEELTRRNSQVINQQKIILAHLGNGASLAAVKNGSCIDTSMGFTPAAGLPMGTRSGDLDPGIAWYLMQMEKLSPQQYNQLINHESGLLGISETSSDMRELSAKASDDQRAEQAIEYFCYQTRKWIGSFAAALGGVDALVFTGGIGEHAAAIRLRICSELDFLGFDIDEKRNDGNEAIISTDNSRVCIHVIPTNEELMIARTVLQFMNQIL